MRPQAASFSLLLTVLALSVQAQVGDEKNESYGTNGIDAVDPSSAHSLANSAADVETYTSTYTDVGNAYRFLNGVNQGSDAYRKVDPVATAEASLISYKQNISSVKETILKNLEKFQGHLKTVEKRVNRWNTTLPTLENFADQSGSFIEDFAHHIQSFEVEDLWDLDQTFFLKMEMKARAGNSLGNHIYGWFVNRLNNDDFWGAMTRIYGDYMNEVPYADAYKKAGITPPGLDAVPNEERTPLVAANNIMAGLKRLQELDFAENGCDKAENPELNCSDPTRSSRRNLYIRRFMEAFKEDDLTTQDIDKLNAEIEKRRMEVNYLRKIIAETRVGAQLKFNDLLETIAIQEAKGQRSTCRSYKTMIIDGKLLNDGDANGCNDVVTKLEDGTLVLGAQFGGGLANRHNPAYVMEVAP